jgi:hypothetical protein
MQRSGGQVDDADAWCALTTGDRAEMLDRDPHGRRPSGQGGFDAAGTAYVAEVGLSFGGAQPGGRIQQLEVSGGVQHLAPLREYSPTDHAVDRLGFRPACNFDRWLEELRAWPDERAHKSSPWP